MPRARSDLDAPPSGLGDLPALMAEAAEPTHAIEDPLFGQLFDRFGDARVVLLGEATHGTSEFYRARGEITRWLVENHGFNIVALEADWPDARVLDAFVRYRRAPKGASQAFTRFPNWMWRNREFEGFLEWLRDHNRLRLEGRRAGIYGLDLYSLSASMRAVIDYLDREDPEAAKVARERYGCLTPWADEPAAYGRLALTSGYARCEGAVTAMLTDLLGMQLAKAAADSEGLLDAAQNARLVRNAEAYYRAMYYGGAEAGNLRDSHMFETLLAVLDAKGPDAKAVVWAHNAHIGDARATDMGKVREELNLGQLCRERWDGEAALIGFGTHGGTVACASDWDAPMEIKPLNPALAGSHERLAHEAGIARFVLDLRPGVDDDLRSGLAEPRLERFIGVIYRPEAERRSHYVECQLPEQFDAWVWFDETRAVTPLPVDPWPEHQSGGEDTWPFGL
ncbi:erythromycin esterase family protein [Phenylobacterium sp.]|jgi:erythromycin esterase-like protein|uniref:erythromycin esterase family protein n=1 Tax=Phenylobacterium sp. TaxID=1871053 RepID=UPI002E3414EC|nr:erythromycin esterase family protein [Phenylobacterium sp.]HEX4712620.1 erythromycin esterase family protein [Phenylobacterium sp.]